MRVGHGQMRERDLEQLMVDFYHRRFNLLVCTTIIESGIDVPTANTIMIDRADKLGLAQLHQLRGRVGRSHHRAYAYLLTPNRKALSLDAVKRLEAIESLEDLGAGFVLATHDLEIRGAGELLGESQSGELTEIGLTMYLDMLEQAVKALKEGREPVLDRPLAATAEVELRLPALLPESYVADVPVRLALYKRLAAAPDNAAIDGLTEEIVDRFGPLPPPATDLLRVARLKLAARALGIRRLDLGPQGGYALFEEQNQVDPRAVIRLVQHPDRDYRLEGALKLRISRRDRRRGRALRVRREIPRRPQGPSGGRRHARRQGQRQSVEGPAAMSDPLYFRPMSTFRPPATRLCRFRARRPRRAGTWPAHAGAERGGPDGLHDRTHRVPQHERLRRSRRLGREGGRARSRITRTAGGHRRVRAVDSRRAVPAQRRRREAAEHV